MSEIDALINAPMGAVFFVCGAISVFVLLAIFILQKGSDIHRFLGYMFIFGLAVFNYASAMAYYDGLLPLPAVAFSIPTSTVFILLGLVSIFPGRKSLLRIKIHIISMVCSTMSLLLGLLIHWFHFSISPFDVVRWGDLASIGMMAVPVGGLGLLLIFQFLSTAHSFVSEKEIIVTDSKLEDVKKEKGEITQGEIHYHEVIKEAEKNTPTRGVGF